MPKKDKNQTEKLIEIFCSYEFGYDDENIEESLKKVVQYYAKHSRHQYHIISEFVNEKMQESEDSISYILNNIEYMQDYMHFNQNECKKLIRESSDLDYDCINLNLEKLYDHIALEEERLKNNAAIIKQSNIDIENNVINTFNSIIGSFQSKVDEVSGSLNANIISVVGLFSAIIFVFFGGITSMANIINGIYHLKSRSDLYIPLICVFTVGFVIFNIVFLLLYSISKIVDKDIGSPIILNTYDSYDIFINSNNDWEILKNGEIIKECKLPNILERIKFKSKIFLLNFWFKLLQIITMFIKKLLFRFPYVVVVNLIFIFSILYLYQQLP